MWWWCTRNMEEKDVNKFRNLLWLPPKGEAGQGPWSAEAETNSFKALQSQVANS